MQSYSLTHLTDAVLLRDLSAIAARDRVMTATLLAHIAEVDARRLYVPAGHPSMHAFCVEHLRYSDDAAFRRIRAARPGPPLRRSFLFGPADFMSGAAGDSRSGASRSSSPAIPTSVNRA